MVNRPIYVISDSTGETAERVVRAALLQFPQHKVRVRVFTRVRDQERAQKVLEKAKEDQAMVVFTLVSPEMRDFFHAWSVENDLGAVDVIGALMGKVSNFLQANPTYVPSSALPLSDDYFKRVEAIEFAVKSDDGREPRNLSRADLILTGVSRTSKTPLSTYLAGRGLKVANVPLVLGVDPPPELFEIPPERVVGLTIDLNQLLEIRRARLQQLGMPSETNYAMRDHIREELDYTNSIFAQHPDWFIVDVSGRAIEETAAIVLEYVKDREERRLSE
ncbi:MAG: kinase/pyrophosphorylase [Myxococcales bacterium]|nr:MAG: kinase/pyrophosphorylase [Myxococcales bacterium]